MSRVPGSCQANPAQGGRARGAIAIAQAVSTATMTHTDASGLDPVHRAADQLLTSNTQDPIVFNPGETNCQPGGMNCTPYVDANSNGWDATDVKLLEDKPALDALTGGLLFCHANVSSTRKATNTPNETISDR